MTDEQLQAIKERYTRDYGELPAAVRADVPALVAEVERLRAQLAAVPVEALRRYWDWSIPSHEWMHRDESPADCASIQLWLDDAAGAE